MAKKTKKFETRSGVRIEIIKERDTNNAQEFNSISEQMCERLVKKQEGKYLSYKSGKYELETAKESLYTACKKINAKFKKSDMVKVTLPNVARMSF